VDLRIKMAYTSHIGMNTAICRVKIRTIYGSLVHVRDKISNVGLTIFITVYFFSIAIVHPPKKTLCFWTSGALCFFNDPGQTPLYLGM
jgi:hypothetical protein